MNEQGHGGPTSVEDVSVTPLLTPRETAAVLKLSVSKVYELCASGKLPHMRVDGSIRMSQDALDDFLRAAVVDQSEGASKPRRRLKSRYFNL